MAYPSLVLNTPVSEPYLRNVFSYSAEAYDLDAYERVLSGAGERIWRGIEKEREFQSGRHMFAQKPGFFDFLFKG